MLSSTKRRDVEITITMNEEEARALWHVVNCREGSSLSDYIKEGRWGSAPMKQRIEAARIALYQALAPFHPYTR